MSGQQAGTAIGFVAGFFLPGGPQVWAGIGGFIGGAVDPTKVQGPKLSDGMAVTAADGIPNTWGFGTFSNGGNIIHSFDLQEHSHTDDGKGSGVEQETFTYTRSYAIAICRAKRRTDGLYDPIAGVLRATHNGKVIYNTQPDATAEQLAQNSKFLETFKFYLGGEDQLPDPTLESYMGAGNVSAYRGEVIMVATDEDQTQSGGSIGTWEFVVAMEGELGRQQYGTLTLGPSNSMWADDAPAKKDPRRPGVDYEYAYIPDALTTVSTWRATLGEAIADYISESGETVEGPTLMGWSTTFYGTGEEGEEPIAPWEDINSGDNDWTELLWLGLIFARFSPAGEHAVIQVFSSGGPTAAYQCASYDDMSWAAKLQSFNGDEAGRNRIVINGAIAPEAADETLSCYIGESFQGEGLTTYQGFSIAVRAKLGCYGSAPPGSTPIPDAPGYWIDPNGDIGGGSDCEEVSGTFKQLQILQAPVFDFAYSALPLGPTMAPDDPEYDDEDAWTSYYDDAVDAGLMDEGLVYGVDYPVVVADACRCDNQPLLVDSVPLATIVAEICRRSGLEDQDFDVSELTDLVGGFKVAIETTGGALIQSLQQGFFFDTGEWDDKLRFIKRGGDVQAELTFDDLCERDGPAIEETEVQEVELLRKVHVKAMDPAAGYVETTQTWERRSSTVAAEGEQTIALPIVADKDTQAQIGEKRGKVAWTERRSSAFDLPYTMPQYTPTDRVGLTDRSGRRQRLRLMEMVEDTGRIQIKEARFDRQSSYTSNIQGVTHSPPTDTSPGLIGPTFFWAGNLPSLRTQDNTPGMYVAGCGFLRAWGGFVLLMSADDGESFQQVAVIRQAATMGTLTAGVSADGEPISVFMNSGTVSSISDAQLANRMNAFAITSDLVNGPSELGQFKTATLDSGQTFDLTDTIRGGLGTTPAAHFTGDPFVMVATATFLPLDISLAGKTLIFKAVSLGTSADETPEYPVVFNPIFTSITVSPLTVGGENITVSGQPIYVVTSNA